MMPLLLWAWLFTLPGPAADGARRPRADAPGYASLPGPPVLLVVAVAALRAAAAGRGRSSPNWLPFLPDGAFRLLRRPAERADAGDRRASSRRCVYVYSLGYMADDPGPPALLRLPGLLRRRRWRCWSWPGNLAVLLIGWTGVGISSFLLICFWRDEPGTLGAGLQALAANAIGDGALLLAAAIVPDRLRRR